MSRAGGDRDATHASDAVSGEPAAPAARPQRGGLLGALRETVIVVSLALGLSLVIKTFLAQAFFIPSESMEPTLVRGDRVVVSKLTPGPFDLKRGDVVVFLDPGDWLGQTTPAPEGPLRAGVREVLTFVGLLPEDAGNHLIKRVIGLPGDKVACCDSEGRVTVNGQPLQERYVFPGDRPSERTFSITVPPGKVWVMGDHRGASSDSRFHDDGTGRSGSVPVDDVVGRAIALVWPLPRFTGLSDHPEVFRDVPAPSAK